MQMIFIHGSGYSGEAWHYQTTCFTGSEAVDLPGHPEGEPKPTIEGYAEWLKSHVAQKGYSDIVLVGHSLGGAVALMYALMYPSDLRGIVTVGSGARLRVHPDTLDALTRMGGDTERFEAFLGPAHEKIEPGLAERMTEGCKANGPEVMLNDLKACDRFDIMDRLDRIHVPVLALCGEGDIMTPPKYSRFLCDKLPGARLAIIPGGTHMVFAEKPERVNRAIETFAAGLGS